MRSRVIALLALVAIPGAIAKESDTSSTGDEVRNEGQDLPAFSGILNRQIRSDLDLDIRKSSKQCKKFRKKCRKVCKNRKICHKNKLCKKCCHICKGSGNKTEKKYEEFNNKAYLHFGESITNLTCSYLPDFKLAHSQCSWSMWIKCSTEIVQCEEGGNFSAISTCLQQLQNSAKLKKCWLCYERYICIKMEKCPYVTGKPVINGILPSSGNDAGEEVNELKNQAISNLDKSIASLTCSNLTEFKLSNLMCSPHTFATCAVYLYKAIKNCVLNPDITRCIEGFPGVTKYCWPCISEACCNLNVSKCCYKDNNVGPSSDSAIQLDGKCGDIMRKENLDYRYPGIVAHGIHSLTLNDIRYFFSPFAGRENGIPVINSNLTQNNSILPNAPFITLDNRFTTSALFAVDKILSHMDDENYGTRNSKPLNEIVHALHMQEVWTNAAQYYQKIKRNPPATPGLCACAKNITETNVGNYSINDFLLYLAKLVRTPELAYYIPEGSETSKFYFTYYAIVGVPIPAELSDEKIPAGPYIKNEKTWQIVKEGTASGGFFGANEAYQLALFLYCKLN